MTRHPDGGATFTVAELNSIEQSYRSFVQMLTAVDGKLAAVTPFVGASTPRKALAEARAIVGEWRDRLAADFAAEHVSLEMPGDATPRDRSMASQNPSLTIRIAANLDDLKKNLSDGQLRIEALGSAVEQIAKKLNAPKLIQDAQNVVAAIEQVGVSSLTTSQAATQLALLEKAMDKMAATGAGIPPAMEATAASLRAMIKPADDVQSTFDKARGSAQQLGDQLSGSLRQSFESPQSAMTTLANLVVTGFSNPIAESLVVIGTLAGVSVAIGEHLLALGEQAATAGVQIAKMSATTGIAVAPMSDLANASKILGTDAGSLEAGMYKLQVAIGEGSTKAQEGIKALGLSFTDLKAESPDQQLLDISTAFRALPEGANKAQIAFELFGKQGKEQLYLLNQPLADLTAQAHQLGITMTTEGVEASEKYEHAVNLIGLQVDALGASVGQVLVPYLADAADSLAHNQTAAMALAGAQDVLKVAVVGTLESLKLQFSIVKDVTGAMLSASTAMSPALGALVNLLTSYVNSQWDAAKADAAHSEEIKQLTAFYGAFGKTNQEAAVTTEDFVAKLKDTHAALTSLSPAVQAQIAAGLKLGASAKDIADGLNLTVQEVDVYRKSQESATEASKKAAEQAKVLKQAISDQNNGLRVSKTEMDALVAAHLTYHVALPTSIDKTASFFSQFSPEATQGLVMLPGKLLTAGEQAVAYFANVKVSATLTGKAIDGFTQTLDNLPSSTSFFAQFAPAKLKPEDWHKDLSQIATDFSQMGQVAGGSLNEIGKLTGTAITGINTIAKSSSTIGSSLMGSVTGVMGIVGAAVQIGSVIASALGIGQTAGRDLVTQFASQQGGFDKLHDSLDALGDSGEALWKKLAQVGQKNPEQAKAVIDEVTAALKNASDAQAQWHKNLDAMTAAGSSVSDALTITSTAIAAQADAKQKISDLMDSLGDGSITDPKQIADIKSQLDALNKTIETQDGIVAATSIHSQSAANAMASVLVGGVAAEIGAGKSMVQALKDQGDGVDSLAAQMQAAGFTGSAAFNTLRSEVDLANDAIAGPALQSIEDYTSAVSSLAGAGLLTQDTFAGLEDQIGATYQSLVDQGKDGHAVLLAMQPDLQKAWELEQQYGFKVDDATQNLIDQGVQAGIVGKDHETATDKMIDGMNDVVKAIDNLIHNLTGQGGLVDQANTAAGGVQDAFANVHPHVQVQLDVPDLPPGLSRPDFDGGNASSGGQTPQGDVPVTAVTKAGNVYVRPGDVVGMPHLGDNTGRGGYNGPSTVEIHVGGEPFLTIDMVAAAMGQGRIPVPSRAVQVRTARS